MAEIFIGTFEGLSNLSMNGETLLLTTLQRQAAQAPESNPLAAARERTGQMAVVRGERDGDVLFEARVVEFVSDLAGRVLQHLLENGQVNADTLNDLVRTAQIELTGGPVDPTPSSGAEVICALVVGHTKVQAGAQNDDGTREFDFNDALAREIKKRVRKATVEIVHRDEPNDYIGLPGKINQLSPAPDFIVSLHCNAFNKQASGTEMLHWHTSSTGERMAKIAQKHLREALNLSNRGVKGLQATDRGAHLLKSTRAPCIIAEPFFIDNDHDLGRANERRENLIDAYVATIDEIAETMKD